MIILTRSETLTNLVQVESRLGRIEVWVRLQGQGRGSHRRSRCTETGSENLHRLSWRGKYVGGRVICMPTGPQHLDRLRGSPYRVNEDEKRDDSEHNQELKLAEWILQATICAKESRPATTGQRKGGMSQGRVVKTVKGGTSVGRTMKGSESCASYMKQYRGSRCWMYPRDPGRLRESAEFGHSTNVNVNG